MELNIVEKLLMNNPIRALLHRHFEARRLLSLGGVTNGGLALEAGCGRGVGVKLLQDVFKVERVHAFDLDPHMIARARHLLRDRQDSVKLWVGDVTAIPARDHTYDHIFDFGAIHHVIDWRASLEEIYRVLKPGGRIYIEEILEKYIVHPLFRRLLDHPQHDRFNLQEFVKGLQDAGFIIRETDQFIEMYAWFVADKPGPVE